MAKYDWAKLKRKYIVGRHKSVRDFAKKEGIIYNAYFAQKTKGWADEKKAKREQKESKIEEEITKQNIASAAEINKRHIAIYNKVLDLTEKSLNEIDVHLDMFGKKRKTGIVLHSKLKSIVQSLEIVQKGQRLALDMDKAGKEDREQKLDTMFEAMMEAFKDEPSQS